MKILIIIAWVVITIAVMGSIIVREPNVESLGAMIQDSIYKELESESKIDKIIIILSALFIIMTTALFIQYK